MVLMEVSGRKRKGDDIPARCRKNPTLLMIDWSPLTLDDDLRDTQICKEVELTETVGSSSNVVTEPPCVSTCSESPGRGHKRKIGCIDVTTQVGRKKKIDLEYDLGKVIGQGKFGSVVLCRCKASGEEFACKRMPKGEEIVHREVEIMQHLSGHPGIVTLKAVYEDAESFYLVMELCSGGRLLDQMAREGRYSEQQAAILLKEVMLVVKYCHDMGVVHRDIKPENILLATAGQIKLADFGLAVRIANGQSLTGVVGSPAYVAPEVLAGDYSKKVDIWSAGVLLHVLLTGVLPFRGNSLETVFEAVKNVNLDFTGGFWESVSQPVRDLIRNMLTRDVTTRFTADEVLMHPWILFYTEPMLKTLTFRPKTKNYLTLHPLTVIPGLESERNKLITNSSLSDDSCPFVASDGSTKVVDVDCGLVDVLTVAISRVRISEPKRSRLCNPASPIGTECSSNITANSLCTAF